MSYELVMTREQIDKDRKAWLEARKTGIGGSDAGVIAGVNHWKSEFELWGEKTGRIEPEDKSDNESIYWGNAHEDAIATRFSQLTGKKLRKSGLLRSVENPFMLADPDRMVVGESAILEIKTTDAWNKDQWEGDKIPDSYYCQILHYMIVTEADKAYIACLIGGNRMVWKEVLFNEEDAGALIELEEKFWKEHIEEDKMPEVDNTDKCSKALNKRFEKADGPEDIELDGTIDVLCHDREKLKAEIDGLEKRKTLIENKIRLAMGESPNGFTTDFKIAYKPMTRKMFNSTQYKKDYPETYEKYMTISATRRLDIKMLTDKEKEKRK